MADLIVVQVRRSRRWAPTLSGWGPGGVHADLYSRPLRL